MSRQAGPLMMSTRANAEPIHTNMPSFSTHHSLHMTDQQSYSFNYKTRQIPSLTAPFTLPLQLSTTQASKTAGGNSRPMGVNVISQTFTYVFQARPSVTELLRALPHLPSTLTWPSQTRAHCVTSEYPTFLILPSILVPSLTPYELIP